MKVKNHIILIGLSILLAGGAVSWLLVGNKPKQKADTITLTILNKEKVIKSTAEDNRKTLTYEHPYLSKADSMNYVSLYDSALYYYKEAAIKFEKEQNWSGYAWANINVGNLYVSVAKLNYKYREALPYLTQALTKSKAYLGNNHPFTGTAYYLLGKYYLNKNESATALQMLHQSLKIRLKCFGKNNMYVARVYDAIGDVYTYIGFDNSSAEKYYNESLTIKEQILDKDDPGFYSSYYNLIAVNELKGDYDKALSYCFEALAKAENLTNRKNAIIEEIHGGIAKLYTNQGEFPKAIQKLNQVITLNLANEGDKNSLQYYYNNLGDIYHKLADYKKAITVYSQAAIIYQRENTSNLDFITGEASNTYQGLGMAYLYLKQNAHAFSYLKQCLDLRLKFYGLKHPETALAYQNLGQYYQRIALLDSALVNYQRALIAGIPNFNQNNTLFVPAVSQINKTYLNIPQLFASKAFIFKQLYMQKQNKQEWLKTSLAYYCLADTLLTLYRHTYDRETSKLAFTKLNQNIYEQALECAFLLYSRSHDDKDLNVLFHFIDRRKSSLLLEELIKNKTLKKIGNTEVNFSRENSLRKDNYYLQSKLEEENAKETPNENILQTLHSRIQSNEKEIVSIRKIMSNAHPRYFQHEYNQDTTQIAHLKKISKQRNAAVLEYFWGDSAVYVLGVYHDKCHIIKVTKNKELAKNLANYREIFLKGYVISSKVEDFRAFQKSSFYIYRLLVKPIREKLAIAHLVKNLNLKMVIIPDGPLSYIPFEALLTSIPSNQAVVNYRNLPYLLRESTVSYTYSAPFLFNNFKNISIANASLVAFSFSKASPLPSVQGQLREFKSKLSELPGSARELTAVSSVMDNGKYFMGEEATEERFKKEAPNFDIIHLALHGEADSTSFYSSRLLFKKSEPSSEDGSLYNYELFDLNLKARLAVLSACESGIGKLNIGEGVYSMARGFTAAGCPSILMTLWKVNDATTATIIDKFYQELSTGAEIDLSVKNAKLKYLEQADRRTSHPANWAAFLLMGDTGAIMETNNYYSYTIILLITAFLIASILFVNYWYAKHK